MSPETPPPPTDPEGESTGMPWFRTWRGFYLFVAACFVTYVILLAALPRIFA
ncbi:MAG: hypothetical protein Q8J74_01665 [Candidatus Didemnitutus sp.]|nr:hypothetical protein [Candidatus Didemnitutus sp.]